MVVYVRVMYELSELFYFNDTTTTEIYTLSLHDALPIWRQEPEPRVGARRQEQFRVHPLVQRVHVRRVLRSEEHTSELQSRQYLVCRLLLEKKYSSQSTTSLNTGPMWSSSTSIPKCQFSM